MVVLPISINPDVTCKFDLDSESKPSKYEESRFHSTRQLRLD